MKDPRLKHRLFIWVFLGTPFVAVAGLTYGIIYGFNHGPSMSAEPVGAGAGNTGGANALGEALFGTDHPTLGTPAEMTARGVVLVAEDITQQATQEHPIYLVSNRTGWRVDPDWKLAQNDAGTWQIRVPAPEPGQTEALSFGFVLGRDGLLELDDQGKPVGHRKLPRVAEKDATGPTPLEYHFKIVGFGK